jgi:hypothetical protein
MNWLKKNKFRFKKLLSLIGSYGMYIIESIFTGIVSSFFSIIAHSMWSISSGYASSVNSYPTNSTKHFEQNPIDSIVQIEEFLFGR